MKKYGLIGHPLSHSFSKKYFTEKFEKEQISDTSYELFELEKCEDIRHLIQDNPELLGLNVTIPHKEDIVPFLDGVDARAAKIGAVNTIKINPATKTLTGYNTDYDGFKNSIKPFLNTHHERALILGTGGASKAVECALNELNVEYLKASRNPGDENEIAYDEINDYVILHHKLIINTTPLGMFPNLDNCPPIPYEALTHEHFLYDLIYNPEQTLFLEKGKRMGCLTLNGMSMLKLQAEKAWEIWNQQISAS